MRHTSDTNASSLALDLPSQPQLLNSYPPTSLTSSSPYHYDTSAYYQPGAHVFGQGPVDFRSRLGSNASLTGMAHSHYPRGTTLPFPQHTISTREQYSTITPSFRRHTESSTRSPTFSGTTLRRNPLSPAPHQLAGFASSSSRMDPASRFNQPPTGQAHVPPLNPTQMLGSLSYTNSDGSSTIAKVDISGSIDKGFFMSEGEWTCYRRNYFACVCSYTLTPSFHGPPLYFTPSENSPQPIQVIGFAMCISAVVAENDQQGIELVQHTPKRDKGPLAQPQKIHLAPKHTSGAPHAMSLYSGSGGVGAPSRMYGDSFGGPAPSSQAPPTEHTFERIQFKQATQNNGKRRAAQQYYHLIIELWADTGNNHRDQYVKVAIRKSAKMIVRGRSPGHYSNDRRGSQSSGPGGSSGNLAGYPMGGISDFPPASFLGGAAAGYPDSRGALYNVRHHDLPAESLLSTQDEKAMDLNKPYQYFPGAIYGSHTDRVEMFPSRSDTDTAMSQSTSSGDNDYRTSTDSESKYYPPPSITSSGRRCGPFEGKSGSSGYYPTVASPSGANLPLT